MRKQCYNMVRRGFFPNTIELLVWSSNTPPLKYSKLYFRQGICDLKEKMLLVFKSLYDISSYSCTFALSMTLYTMSNKPDPDHTAQRKHLVKFAAPTVPIKEQTLVPLRSHPRRHICFLKIVPETASTLYVSCPFWSPTDHKSLEPS